MKFINNLYAATKISHNTLAAFKKTFPSPFFSCHNHQNNVFCSTYPNVEFSNAECKDILDLGDGLLVHENFITANEGKTLMDEIDSKWGKLKYQEGHWDNV